MGLWRLSPGLGEEDWCAWEVWAEQLLYEGTKTKAVTVTGKAA